MSRPLVRLAAAIGLALAALLLLLPGLNLAAATQLLVNPGLNDPFNPVDRTFRGSPQTLADGWHYYYVPDGTYNGNTGASKLYWMSSHQFALAFGGPDYYREGNASQVIWSSYQFDAGIYQQVGGLSVGKDYAFEMGMASYWRGSGYPITNGKMKKCLGIDPYGGTSPTSTQVIWDWANCDSTDKTWPYLNMAATAQATTMTVFVRIQAPENDSINHTDLDYVFIDDGRMALAPTATLTVPAVSTTTVSFSWTASAADGWSLKGVEVQYRDEADGVWYVVQGQTGTGTSSQFSGQAGHTYTIRARPWEKRVEAAGTYDLPGLWVEKQTQVRGVFAGYVRNNFGAGIGGAVVSITGRSAYSGPGGFFGLQPPAYGQVYTLTASASRYGSPPPVSAAVADALSITPVTFTLKPADDGIVNGDFESDLGGWTVEGSGSAAIFSDGHRSGNASLSLTGPITLSQRVVLTDVYNPDLAFWYKPGGGPLEVRLEGDGASASKIFAASTEWQPAWLALGVREAYSGAITASFQLAGGTAYLDEVSLGSGPHITYLPLILASFLP